MARTGTLRHSITAAPLWKSAATAGLVAGIVHVVLSLGLGALSAGPAPGEWLRHRASLLLGPDALASEGLEPSGAISALLVHFTLAVIYGLLLASVIHRWRPGSAVLAGVVFGLGIYVVNFHLFTAGFPAFAPERGAATLVLHLAFGAVLAWAYLSLQRRQREHERPT